MKKVLIAVTFCVVACIAVGFFLLRGEKKASVPVAAFLPADALISFEQKDLGNIVDELKNSALGTTLSRMDLVGIATDIGVEKQNVDQLRTTETEILNFLNGPLFKELFGKDFSFALFAKSPAAADTIQENLENRLLMTSKPEHGVQLMSLLTSGMMKASKQTSVQYRSFPIGRFQLENGKNLYTATVGERMLVAFDEQIIKESLDCYTKKKKSLEDLDVYQQLRSVFADPVSFSYLNMRALSGELEELTKGIDQKQQIFIRNELKLWRGIRAIGTGSRREQGKVNGKAIFLLDTKDLDPLVRKIYAVSPEKDSALSLVPDDSLAYYWTNTMDLPMLWDMYRQNADHDRQQIEGLRAAVKNQFGMDVEQVLGIFDRQCGLIIRNPERNRLLPLPEFAFFSQLKDDNRFRELADRFFQKNAIRPQTMEFNGIKIFSASDLGQAGVVPSYAIVDKYIVFSSGVDMLQKIIESVKTGHSLRDNPGFQKVDGGLLEENNSAGYVRLGDTLRMAKEMLRWTRAVIALKDKANAQKVEIVMDRLVNPLLDGLASQFSDFGMRSRFLPDRLILESSTAVNR